MNRAMTGAYRKGHAAGNAFRVSGSKVACPYLDTRKPDGRLTFSRAFRKAWWDGYEDGCSGKKQKHK